jgi:acylphosphatase
VSAVRVIIEGRVQGVGFRAWVYDEALNRGLRGWVRNLYSGGVEAVFSGPDDIVEAMVEACGRGPRLADVTKVSQFSAAQEDWTGFEIRRSAP